MHAPTIELLHGAKIPGIGLGTWPFTDDEAASAVRAAIESGYRLIDTAEAYGNEVGVGQAIRDSGVPREELFITSKFNKQWHSVDGVAQTWANSAERLGVDYIDLLLIHWPNPGHGQYVEAWRGLTRLLEQGKVRAIGTSNFKPKHLQRIIDEVGVVPDVNQIELNPYHQRRQARDFHTQHGIVTESWSPIKPAEMLADPAIRAIAERHGVTPAQAALRWHIQHGLLPIPKSGNPKRQRENLDVFSFELTPEEMAAIDALDRGDVGISDSDTFGH